MDALDGRILLDAGGLLAIDKWPGAPSTGRTLDDPDCVQWEVIQNAGEMVWAAHQLDADTSGVLLFARRKELVAPLKAAMGDAAARKLYLAVVEGRPAWEELSPTGAIGPRDDGAGLWISESGRAARTDLRVIERGRDASLVEARPRTGRTHQIRIHLAALGHPLIGEEWYRTTPCRRHPRQALHARVLRLPAPFDVEIESPVPADLGSLLQDVGLHRGAETGPGPRAS